MRPRFVVIAWEWVREARVASGSSMFGRILNLDGFFLVRWKRWTVDVCNKSAQFAIDICFVASRDTRYDRVAENRF